MSHDLAGCTFTDSDGQGFSFNVSQYCGPASLGADRRLVQIRLAGLGGDLGDIDEIVSMRPVEFRRVLHSMQIAESWIRDQEAK